MKNIKGWCGIILILAGIIGCLVAVVWSSIFGIQNPDMADMRKFIENPGPSILAIGCLISLLSGKHLLGGD